MAMLSRTEQFKENIYDFNTLMTAQLPEPQWLIKDWLINEPTIVAGRPKTFKSTLAMEMAVSIASDTPLLDNLEWPVTQRGPVVYIMEENSAGSTRILIEDIMVRKGLGRLALAGESRRVWEGTDIPLYVLAREGFKLEDDWVQAALEFCREVGAKVIMFDAWYRVLPSGTDEKYGTDLADVFDRIQLFAKEEEPITPLLVAHMNKGGTSIDNDTAGVSIMGSTYVEGFFEGFIMTYHAKSGRNGSVDVKRMYRNAAWPESITLGMIDVQDRKAGWEWGDFQGNGKAATKRTDKVQAFENMLKHWEGEKRPTIPEIKSGIKAQCNEGVGNDTVAELKANSDQWQEKWE